MVERPPAANDDTPPELSQTVKLIIGMLVFALGVLAGVSVAAWFMPPS
jgi:hypothetical protein